MPVRPSLASNETARSELSLADIDAALEELLFAGGLLNRQLLREVDPPEE